MHDDPLPQTDAELRTMYRRILNLRVGGVMTEMDALDLVIVCAELGRRGYTLNADETDWLPKGEIDGNGHTNA